MAFDPTRLYSLLQNTGLAIKDNALFQVISQIISALGKINSNVNGVTTIITGGGGGNLTATYVTINGELALPNSRQLVAGTNITLDTTTPGQVIINASGGGSGTDHVVMSDGGTPIPLTIDDGFGNFVYVAYTP